MAVNTSETAQGPGAAFGPADVRAAFTAGQDRLRSLLPGLTEDALRAPSALPGWSRGHVLTHVEGVGLALARQARYALRGRQVEVYDGGRPARDAAIEAGHGRSAPLLRAALEEALDEVDASWSGVGAADWDRPVRYRDGTLTTVAHAWWRELEIHTSDALLGPTVADWPHPFCAHLVSYLSPRLPADLQVTLTATDNDTTWSFGEGRPVTVTGHTTDLAAWLAGRHPTTPLTGDPLPPLSEWP